MHIISPTYSAFVSGILISDNYLLASEISHFLSKGRQGKKGFLTLKLDIGKAYDRIEWNYFRCILIRIGFSPKWIALIMEFICSVSYSFVINKHPRGYLIPSRGIRKSDPISPIYSNFSLQACPPLLPKGARKEKYKGFLFARAPQV